MNNTQSRSNELPSERSTALRDRALSARIAPDAAQLRQCLHGDLRAWDRLLAWARPRARIIARREFGLRGADLDDASQLACVKLYERLPELRDAAALSGWLRCLVRRTVIDYLRQRRQTLSLDAVEPGGDQEILEAQAQPWEEQTELRLDLQRALQTLPPRYREPVLLHLLAGESQEEISLLLGVPRSTVASQISRGLARLRRSSFVSAFA